MNLYIATSGGLVYEIPGDGTQVKNEGSDLLHVFRTGDQSATVAYIKLEPGMTVLYADEPPAIIGEPEDELDDAQVALSH